MDNLITNNENINQTNSQTNPQLNNQPNPQPNPVGRPPIFRWPGLEFANGTNSSTPCFTRKQQLAYAEEEAAAREELYGGEAALWNLKFDAGPDGPHTTIDFDKMESRWAAGNPNPPDPNNELPALITTSDFIVYNKIKKLMEAGAAVEIVDLKFNQTGNAVFFVTATVPMSLLRKIVQKY